MLRTAVISSFIVLYAALSVQAADVGVNVQAPGVSVRVGTQPPPPKVIVVEKEAYGNDDHHDHGKHKGHDKKKSKHKKHKKDHDKR